MEQKTNQKKPETVLIKDGVEISMPELDKQTELNIERFAEFMARMIRKYGQNLVA